MSKLTLKILAVFSLFIIASSYPSRDTGYYGERGYRKVKTYSIISPKPAVKIYEKYNSSKNIYTVTEGVLYCLKASNAKVIWKVYTGNITNVSEFIRHNNKIYFGRHDGWVFCLDANTGRVIWKKILNEEYMPVPVLDNNLIYLSGDAQNLYVLNADTGETVKRIYNEGSNYSVAISGNYILIPSHEKLFLYKKTDNIYKMVWVIPFDARYMATPVITETNIFLGSTDKHIYSLDINTGNVVWKYKTLGEVNASLFTDKDYVYAGSQDGNLYCLKKTDGTKKYSMKVNAPIIGNIITKGNNIYFSTLTGNVYCAHKTKSFIKWKYFFGSKNISSICFSDNAVAVCGKDKGAALISSHSGTPFWEFSPGLKLSEAEQDGNVLYCTTLKGRKILKYSVKDKKVIWEKKMPALTLYKPFVFRKDLFYFSTQSLYILDKINGKIKSLHNVRMECNYPVIYKNHLCASYQNKIFNYNIKDRKFDWIKTIKGNIYKGITLDNWKLIFATSKGKIYSVQTKRGITEFETGTGTAIYALPVVYEDYIYIGDVNGIFYAVNKTSGKIIWKFKTFGKISSSAAVSKTNIYFGSEAHFIYNFDRLKLTKIWNSSERTAFGTSPVIFGDYLITSGNTGEVYFVLKKNGDFRGSYFIGSKVNGKIKIHDNKIIFTTESGYIHILSEKRN